MLLATPLRTLWRHRLLTSRLARRDIAARWKGSFLGPFWSLLTPLLMLGVYTFVFGTVLHRTAGSDANAPPFAIYLLSGLLLVQLFAETLNGATSVIRTNASFVKQVVFPLEILPFVGFLVAVFNTCISALVLLVGYIVFYRWPPPLTALWLPLIVLPLPFFAMGLAWFIAALGTYMRDTAQITALCTSIFLFMCPVFYALENVPENYRAVLQLNPLTPIVSHTRAALFDTVGPSFWGWGVALLVALVVFQFGFWFFAHTKNGFADVV